MVVTGASSGIGRAVALAFAHRGARIVVTARSAAALGDVAQECEAAHARAEAVDVPADVTDAKAIARVAETALDRFGRIDVWVNAAGVGVLGLLDRIPPDEARRVWEVNVQGALHGALAALPTMRSQGHGVLIDVSSILGGRVDAPYMGPYAASKAALVSLDEVLRQELVLTGERGVAVCTVLPGGVDTPFFAHAANRTGRRVRFLPALATPERVARAVVRTAARPRRHVYVGPGARLLPWANDTAPGLVRPLIRHRTEHGYLGAPGSAPVTTGTLFTPSADTASVTGGRHGRARTVLRRACLIAAAAAATGAGLRGSRSHARRHGCTRTHSFPRPHT
ncbi:SDR family NAD(P)-dependent oxidoreductase [Streptomyces sp. NPDC051921]|uniref:SDR family NAD(P)-dependent oxidoreductase n=1 Tax=Streptomyces sp. NPDC051921 TaxID=3155806 RepID=UPI003415974E